MAVKEVIMVFAVLLGFVLMHQSILKYDRYTATKNVSALSKIGLLYLIVICPVAGYALISYKTR
jgi:hypothetical protein